MSKHSLFPVPLPAAKRLHASSSLGRGRPLLSFDSLYDELILSVFSHLSFADLCVTQSVNKNWYRLAADNELWRYLYLRNFGRARLRGSRGFITRSDGREVRPLPGRASSMQEDPKDWKWMFRISSNWRKGRCVIEQLREGSPSSTPQLSAHQRHVLLAGDLTITASSQPPGIPTIRIFDRSGTDHILICESQLRGSSSEITTLAIDQSPPSSGLLRLVSFLSTGEFVIFTIQPSHLVDSSQRFRYIPTRRRTRESYVIKAAYHHPLLVALSQDFKLSIYDLSSDSVKHTQTLSSFTSFPPTSLVLSTPTPNSYKLVIAYTIPVYPAHWSVGATELMISGPSNSVLPSSSLTFLPSLAPVSSMCVISTRTTRALDVPQGWIDDDKLGIMHEQWSRKVCRVADTQTDGKWIVLASAEEGHFGVKSTPSSLLSLTESGTSLLNSFATLQLYRLYLPSPSSSIGSSPPKMTFVRNLHGQIGPISSLALSDGRCVSLGVNGSLWVWDLEAGTGVEASACNLKGNVVDEHLVREVVIFDEKRIVTTEAGRVVIRRFDM